MKKILIIGESCMDIFVYCKADRLAPDLPIPVLNIVGQKENPGMAKNVERNVKNIFHSCQIVTNRGWQSVTKTRYMHHGSNHAFLRVDTSHVIPRIDMKGLDLDKYQIVAISDYNKGFLTEQDIQYICQRHGNVFLDTKKILGDWAKKAKFVKINSYEHERSEGIMPKELKNRLIVTKGDLGAMFRGKIFPVEKVEVKDVSGAGDSFFAALIVKYAETGDIEESIKFANKCASKVVQHKGVSVIERQD